MPPKRNPERQPTMFGPITGDRLYRIAQQYKFGSVGEGLSPSPFMEFTFWEGVLLGDMAAPDDFLTNPVKVDANILILDTDNLTSTDDIPLKEDDRENREQEVTNRYPWQTASEGDYVAGHIIRGEYRVMFIDTSVETNRFHMVRFEITQPGDEGDDSVRAVPQAGSCNILPDQTVIIVYDGLGCVFDEPFEDLDGRQGYAVLMKSPSVTGTGTGDDCRWEVISLCCPPEPSGTGSGS